MSKELDFLKESNKIEREYSQEALADAVKSWEYSKVMIPIGRRIDMQYIKTIHKFLMKRLNLRIAGKIRACPVIIGGKTKWNNKGEIEEELRLLCNPGLYPISSESLIKRWHIKFEAIHPFEDGNGRTGRILMNIQRLLVGLPILIIHEGKEQQEYYKWFREDVLSEK